MTDCLRLPYGPRLPISTTKTLRWWAPSPELWTSAANTPEITTMIAAVPHVLNHSTGVRNGRTSKTKLSSCLLWFSTRSLLTSLMKYRLSTAMHPYTQIITTSMRFPLWAYKSESAVKKRTPQVLLITLLCFWSNIRRMKRFKLSCSTNKTEILTQKIRGPHFRMAALKSYIRLIWRNHHLIYDKKKIT